MGEFTYCNKCTWERIKTKNPLAKLKSSKKMPGWTAAVVNEEEIAWFMEMPEKCACG